MVSKAVIAIFIGCIHYNVFAITDQKQSLSSPAQTTTMTTNISLHQYMQETCTSKTPIIQTPRPNKASSLLQRMLQPFKKSPSCPNLSDISLETHHIPNSFHKPRTSSYHEKISTSTHETQNTSHSLPIFHDAYDDDPYDDDLYQDSDRSKKHNAYKKTVIHTHRATSPTEEEDILLSYFSADGPHLPRLTPQQGDMSLITNQPLSSHVQSASPDTKPQVQTLQNTFFKDHAQEDSRPPTPPNSSPIEQKMSPCEDPLLLKIVNNSALLLTLQAEYTQHWPRFTLPPKSLLRQKKLRPDLPPQKSPLKNWHVPSLPPQNPYVYYDFLPNSSTYTTLIRNQKHGHLKQLACLLLFLGKSQSLTISGEECAKHSFINIEVSAQNICTKYFASNNDKELLP